MKTTAKRIAQTQAPFWLKVTSGILLVVLLMGTWAFVRAYADLNQSIHE